MFFCYLVEQHDCMFENSEYMFFSFHIQIPTMVSNLTPQFDCAGLPPCAFLGLEFVSKYNEMDMLQLISFWGGGGDTLIYKL